MNLFPFDIKKLILVIFVFALPLISINFQRAPGETAWYMKPVTAVAGSVEIGYASFSKVIRSTAALYVNLINTNRENSKLKSDLVALEARVARYDELQIENQRLTQSLEFRDHTPSTLMSAHVIGQDLFGAQHRTIRIDRGTNDRIQRGQAVVSPDGVVGYVFDVDVDSSNVLVVTDRYAVIDATVQRTRARGIVEGKTATTSSLKYLHRSDDVQPGDVIVTSGLDNIFPQGFPIARVVSVEKRNFDITQKVELEPLVRLSRLEEVFIVTKTVNPKPILIEKPAEAADPKAADLKSVDPKISDASTATATAVLKDVKKDVKEVKKP